MTGNILLTPPVALLIMLAAVMIFAKLLSALSFKNKKTPEGLGKPYACGEDVPTGKIQPDYSQFFPFAFFFTFLHVIALVLTTMPKATLGASYIFIVYILGAITGLFILFRR